MTLRDSLVVIAYRDRFPDLAAALALVGAALGTDAPALVLADTAIDDTFDLFAHDVDSRPQGRTEDGWSAEDIDQVEGSASAAAGEGEADDGAGSRHAPADEQQTAAASNRRRGSPPRVIASVIARGPEPAEDTPLGPASPPYTSVPMPWAAPQPGHSAADSAFNVRTLSSTLHSMVRVERESADPDVDAVVARIASGEPLARVPMVRRPGPPRSICVLCDLSLRSGPYRDDVRYLIRVARRLFGDGSVELLTFKGTPAKGCGTGPVWTWGPHAEQPAYDITVIIGCGAPTRQGDPSELHSFAMDLIAADREVCVILIGAEPGVPKTRPYPQLLVRD